MRISKQCLLAALMAFSSIASAQGGRREPHVNYIYPSGGQQGAVVQILLAGKFLGGIGSAYVSGEGVHVSILEYAKPLNNQELQELRKQLTAFLKERSAGGTQDIEKAIDPAFLQHPLLRNMGKMDRDELEYWARAYFDKKKKQGNPQPTETALVEITIGPNAAPGDREIRFGAALGLTNPLRFQVGAIPEMSEREPNDAETSRLPEANLPVVLNGQVLPGDVDRFAFRAYGGQRLVIDVQARRLMPYLADAVPGWFQAVAALYDAAGHELAVADDYNDAPDPVLFYEVPKDGEYVLEIRDALYRGREDFVYRASIGSLPFVTRIYPLGGRAGEACEVSAAGWNLAGAEKFILDTMSGGLPIREATWRNGNMRTNSVRYAVETLPEFLEAEGNDNIENAQRISLPAAINGRIDAPGDEDVFRIDGPGSVEVTVEVFARRLDSPLDSLLRFFDASGSLLAMNDDYEDKGAGLVTHHADSYLCGKLPADGTCYVQVSDAQHHGGEAYAYRLRVTARQPDFALRVTPSSLNVVAGRCVPLTVHVLRKDGFNGAIEVALKDAPGFALEGARIPAGRDSIRMTLTAPPDPPDQPVSLHLEGHAQIGGETLSHPAVPAEDMMQAFAYRHLVPTEQLLVAVTGAPQRAQLRLLDKVPLRIPAGGTTQIRVGIGIKINLQQIQLELSEVPAGITLDEVATMPDGWTLTLKTDAEAIKPGYSDNLIVEAFTVKENAEGAGSKPKQQQRNYLGSLPAIPFDVIEP